MTPLEEEAWRIFRKRGVIVEDTHVVLKSTDHASAYVNKNALYMYPEDVSKLCLGMVKGLRDRLLWYRVVAGPATGGVALTQWYGSHASQQGHGEVLAVYCEEEKERTFHFRRGYDRVIPGQDVLVVEDVLSTGRSAKGVVDAVKLLGGNVVGVSALYNRGGVTAEDLGVPFLEALITHRIPSYREADCPMCLAGDVPINTGLGHGQEFLERKAREAQGLSETPVGPVSPDMSGVGEEGA